MKFIFQGILMLSLTCISLSGCKKDKSEVTSTTNNYSGETALSQSDRPNEPSLVFKNSTLYVKTDSDKNIEVVLNADVAIKYKGKYHVSTSTGFLFSGDISPVQETQINFYPSVFNSVILEYSKLDKVMYRFVGK